MLCAFQFMTMALQRAQVRGWPRGGLWWFGRCWTAPSLAASLAAVASAAAAAHGVMHLCQLTADARNRPGDRVVWWIRRRNREQGATVVTGEIDMRF